MAKTKETKTEPEVKRTRRPVVKAGACPKNETHTATKVYRTDGRTRYCKCNDCGHNWKIVADYSDDLHQYVHELANDLDAAERIEGEGGLVVVLTDKAAADIAKDLRDLVETA